ncbi:hypothetical protein IQ250_20270 [Pseudanabaenaceae cyanobacterium LEGE 13415]|nr:hypothetical protein [Pseudanabaenaceae cyanobacterium LEGE 13415]
MPVITPLLEASELEDLLIYINKNYQVNLTGYRRSTLMRRTQTRMQQIRIKNYQDYLDYLQQQPDEIEALLDTIYINYTYFFRDPSMWIYLADQ